MLEIVFLYSFAKGKLCEKVKKPGVEYREEPFICSRMGSPFIYILFFIPSLFTRAAGTQEEKKALINSTQLSLSFSSCLI